MQLAPLAQRGCEFPGRGLLLDFDLICSAAAEGSQVDGLCMPFPAWLGHQSVGRLALSEGAPVDLLGELHSWNLY